MICRENNSTKTTLGSFSKDKQLSNKDKLCLCDEENGYMENIIEKHCNGKFNSKNISKNYFSIKRIIFDDLNNNVFDFI